MMKQQKKYHYSNLFLQPSYLGTFLLIIFFVNQIAANKLNGLKMPELTTFIIQCKRRLKLKGGCCSIIPMENVLFMLYLITCSF